jgi:hexosaminidase
LKLLPHPRFLRRQSGTLRLPAECGLHLPGDLPKDTVLLPLAARVQEAAHEAGFNTRLITGGANGGRPVIRAVRGDGAPAGPDGYAMRIDAEGIQIEYREEGGLRAAVATLRQLLREHGRRLPCLVIRDHADFAKRGVMLDVSRGRVPKLETLLELAERLADFKINELQLYTEHTFAYGGFEAVWRESGAITGREIGKLDARCRELGIELVPNQNSFGHLRRWLEHPPLRHLAETGEPWPDQGGAFLRYPSTLAPTNPGSMRFLRRLYDELLPHFSSRRFNVGCDETWDLGRGQSRGACTAKGKGRVYLEFLQKIHRELERRGRRMMFWGDIVLHYPELIRELPGDVIALNWGYEADHPFEREAALFAKAGIEFYVCPGTSMWTTLIGRHDNSFTNLKRAASAGLRHGAAGYLITDWGDCGHLQPPVVSWLPYIAGASQSWCARSFDEALLVSVVSRDVFHDQSGRSGEAALGLGLAHRKLRYHQPNLTPLGAVVAAPQPEKRELWCRDGLKYYARIEARDILAALEEVEKWRAVLHRARPETREGALLAAELDLAARLAGQSCKYMLWQQAVAAGCAPEARRMARRASAELRELKKELMACWSKRNKTNGRAAAACLDWRLADYKSGVLHFPPKAARAGAV